MQLESGDTVEAVVLVEGEQITRELLYPEFEAILDGYVSDPHFEGKAVKAVYLVINSSLCITRAVFFVLDFDDQGMVDQRWNIPLRGLAEASSSGPNLGAGPIRLACFSQCCIEVQRNKLWDPQMEPRNNSFSLLKKAIKANRLGLSFKAPAPALTAMPVVAPEQLIYRPGISKDRRKPTAESEASQRKQLAIKKKLHEHYSQELRDRLASELKGQRLRIATLQSGHQDLVKKMLREHQQRVSVYQQHLHKLEEQVAEFKTQNAAIKERLDMQAGKVQGIREYYSHKLKMVQSDEADQQQAMQAMQENIALEMELKVQAATRELTETLDMRNVELFYRHQNEASLKEEVVQLKQQYQALLTSSGEQLLTRLNSAGVSFVVFHPGVGQFTVALADLSRYLASPVAFAAQKLDIPEALYSGWLKHCENPLCTAQTGEGKSCGRPLAKIDSPLKFHLGESDRCDEHQAVNHKLSH
ncbi:MAG TPA: hypothetical protein VN030_04390 [Cellvibrio sp.]|nr:hypothetical protein [Cellvibrio sp.]